MTKLFSIFFLLLFLSAGTAFANSEFNYNKAIAEYSRGDYETSVRLLTDILKSDPDNSRANHLAGLSYYKLEDYGNAVSYLETAKKLDPEIENINLDLGSAYLKAGDLENAKAEFENEVSMNPQSGIAHYNLGYTNFLLGDYEEAIVSLNESRSLDQNLAVKADYYAGISNFRLNQFNTSRQNFEYVLKGNPPRDISQSVQDYLDVINQYNKRYYGTITAGMQYDSNVSLEPDDVNIFTNENDFSGIFYVNLGFKPFLGDKGELGLDYKGFLSLHFDITDFNIQNHRFTLFGNRQVSEKVRLYFDYYYDLVFIGDSTVDELFSQTHSFKPGITYDWNDNTSTNFIYNLKYRDFEDFPERDAFYHRWAVSQTFRLFSGKFFFVPGGAMSLNTADDIPGTRNYTYFAPEAFVDVLVLFNHGLTAYFNVYYLYQNYYDDDFDREDNQLGVRAILSQQIYNGISLDLGYQYILNDSNSSFPGFEPFDYTRHIFTTALSYSF